MPVGGDLFSLLIVFYSLRSTSVTTFVTMAATAAPASFPITSFSLFECFLFLLLLIFLGFNLTLLPLTYLTIAALVFLGAKVGEHREMIFHWLIFPVFCCLGCI